MFCIILEWWFTACHVYENLTLIHSNWSQGHRTNSWPTVYSICIQALACMYGPVVFAALQQDAARAGYTLYSIRISKPFRLELLKLIVLLSSYCIGHDPFGWLRGMHTWSRHQISLCEFTTPCGDHMMHGQHCWCLKMEPVYTSLRSCILCILCLCMLYNMIMYI